MGISHNLVRSFIHTGDDPLHTDPQHNPGGLKKLADKKVRSGKKDR